jgi:hypothetical protein
MRTGCPDCVVVKYAMQTPPFRLKCYFSYRISRNALKYKLLLLFLQMPIHLSNSLNFGLPILVLVCCHEGFGAFLYKPKRNRW